MFPKKILVGLAIVLTLLLGATAAFAACTLVLNDPAVSASEPPYSTVLVSGSVRADGQPVVGVPVALRLSGDAGQLLAADQVSTGSQGVFSTRLALPAGTKSGSVTLVAAAAGSTEQKTVEIPLLPAAYYGSVKDANGQGVASGKMEAYIDGRKAGEIDFSNGFYGGSGGLDPKLVVSGTEADRGKSVIFKVITGGQTLEATAEPAVLWQPGDVQRVDLTVTQIPQVQDTTPPSAPANLCVTAKSSSSVTLTWDPSTDNVGVAKYVVEMGTSSAQYQQVGETQVTSFSKSELSPSTTYNFRVKAMDDAGNSSPWSNEVSVTTEAANTGGGGGGGGGGGAPTPSADKVEKLVQAGTTTVAEISGKVKIEVPTETVSGANASIVAEVVGDEKASGTGMSLLGRVVDITLKNGTLTGNGKITITLYFDKSKLGKDQEPAAFYYDEKAGKWVRLEGTVDSDKGTVTVIVDHFTMFAVFAVAKEAPKPPVVSFKDMQGHWAATAVGRLAAMGVISGYPNGTFKPDNEITRAEVTAILVRALKLAPGKEEDLKFADSAAIPAWAKGVVAAAAKEGLIRGYPQPDGAVTFEADRPLSRVEMAALVVRILEKKIGTVTPAELKFADAGAIPDWAKASVGAAVAKGIVAGYPDGTFRADKPVTRAEAAAMVLRLLDSVGNK